jgi:molecular chaperone GrpE
MAKSDAKKASPKKTSSKNKVLEDKIESLEASVQEEKDRFVRLFAEFENYKKRTAKERIELFKTASQELMTALLPVMDDFERALAELAKSEDHEQNKGVELIYNKLADTLQSNGLSKIDLEKGVVFDAELHEAITQIPAPEESLKGKVVDVVGTGYKLGEKIIRYPKVVVGN